MLSHTKILAKLAGLLVIMLALIAAWQSESLA